MHADDHYHDMKNYVSSMGKHSHICMVYSNREQQITALAEYFRTGLRLGQKCVYISHPDTAAFVRNVLQRAGMDVENDVKDGSLTFLTPEQTYLVGGTFNGDTMLGFIQQMIADAYADGFNGLRGAGDMSWALDANITAKELIAYESSCNRIFEQLPLMGMCQYDQRSFHPETVRMLVKTHPTIIKDGHVFKNPHFVPPDQFVSQLEKKESLQLAV
ncbi:MAG TPA: MEDS domain-containing protein [Candidatus Melainabacteria bacterium]|nr:MEDS domain-containing protein [Candidatus Melainabacteria bacterium]